MLFVLRQTLIWLMFIACTAGLLLTFAELAFSDTEITQAEGTIEQAPVPNAESALIWLEGRPELSSWLQQEGLKERVLDSGARRPEILQEVAQVRDHVNLRGSEKLVNLLLAIEVARTTRLAAN